MRWWVLSLTQSGESFHNVYIYQKVTLYTSNVLQFCQFYLKKAETMEGPACPRVAFSGYHVSCDIMRVWGTGSVDWIPLPLPESTMAWEITLATEDLCFCPTISVFALNPSSNLCKSLGSSYLHLGSPLISCDEKSYDSTEILNFPKTEPDTFTLWYLPHPPRRIL